MDRREFLQMLRLFSGAALLSSCGSEQGQKRLISYLVPPEDGVTPGQALWYPATCTECPAGCGVQVRVREGWPVKLEGIPDHPVSSGGLCMRGQASLWRLYHPDRLRAPQRRSSDGTLKEITWDEAFALILQALRKARGEGRQNGYLAARTTGSLAELIDTFCEESGIERLPEFELFSHAALRQAYGRLFGIPDLPRYRPEKADFLLTLGADLLETFVSPVDYAAQVARAREQEEFRWLHLEPHFSLTGANAGERLVLRPGSEPHFLAFLMTELAGEERFRRLPPEMAAVLPNSSPEEAARATGLPPERLWEIARELKKARRPLVIAGGVAAGHRGALATTTLATLIQWMTGQIGETVDFTRTENYASVGSLRQIEELAERLAAAEIGVLFIARANPVYQVPQSLAFSAALEKAALRVGLGNLPDETLRVCDLLLPLAHSLESWGDAEPRRGIRSLIRPAVKPRYDTRSEGEILLELLRRQGSEVPKSYREYLFARWSGRYDTGSLKDFSVRGFLVEQVPERTVRLAAGQAMELLGDLPMPDPMAHPSLVLVPSIRRFDGRSRPLPLLSEVPDPLTTISYGPWVSVGPATARRLMLEDGAEMRLAADGWTDHLPVKIQPGLAEDVLMIQRDQLEGAPFTVDPGTGEAVTWLKQIQTGRTGRTVEVPILAGSPSQHGRGLIPDRVHRAGEKKPRPSLYPEHEHPDYRWAMAVDLKRCIGCGACAAACYVENNVPVVGAEDHLKGREMSWLRIEPFYGEAGRVEFLPMLCQHCHNAPCEPVCPVYAAYHNPEGLNIQVYQRCVGTRYCSNNCPYKVRRFNWWTHRWPGPLKRMQNPDLTVRTKGIMEKCTFCIQRIRAARDTAKDEGRKIRDGEVIPACAQSCPTGAIAFGNLLDPASRVSKLAGSERAYRVFEELGTETSIYYLRRT